MRCVGIQCESNISVHHGKYRDSAATERRRRDHRKSSFILPEYLFYSDVHISFRNLVPSCRTSSLIITRRVHNHLRMHTNFCAQMADLYFLEELKCTIGEEQSFQWLMSASKKATTLSANRSPRSSHPNSPRPGHGHPGAAPSRKYAVPGAGAFWRNRDSFCSTEAIQASQVSGFHEGARRSSSSSSLSTSSSSSDFSHSFHELDAQQLSTLIAGDAESGSKLGLLFTDAAHSVLDSA